MFFNEYEPDIYTALNKLSVHIPQEIIDREISGFKSSHRVEQFQLITEIDFGKRKTITFAASKDEMFFHIMYPLLKDIAIRLEVHNRAEEQKKWRYVHDCVVDGEWKYLENDNYKYNAIYDSRKAWFEFHIRSIAEIFSIDMTNGLIEEYSELINMWYPDEHWQFNQETMEFVEISLSKEIDEEGKEHPQENEIIKD